MEPVVIYAEPGALFEPTAHYVCRRADDLGVPVTLRGKGMEDRVVRPGDIPEHLINSLWNELIDKFPWKARYYGWQRR